jgi:HK97 family phage portal protein
MWPFSRKSKTVDQIAREIDEGQSGTVVTESSSLGVAAVLACVDVIATSCAVPAMHVMRNLGDDQKEKARDSDLYRLLHRRPNEFQTSLEFRETMTMHAALTGNAYAVPVRDLLSGRVRELLPVMPSQVTIENRGRYDRIYSIHDEFGLLGRYAHDQVFHLRNRSWDRCKGLSVVRQAASAIGLSMATEANIKALQENGGRPGGLLSTEKTLSPDVIERLKHNWSKFKSKRRAYDTAVLDSGLNYTTLAMAPVDTQTLETRRMQVEEICRAFGVFPQMVGYSDKTATFASAEAFFSAHNRITVNKWQENWRQKLDEFVLDGAGPLFVEFDNRSMLSASVKDQGEFFARALGVGGGVPFMTVNEVRAERGLPPIDGGDALREPIASTQKAPSDQVNEQEGQDGQS